MINEQSLEIIDFEEEPDVILVQEQSFTHQNSRELSPTNPIPICLLLLGPLYYFYHTAHMIHSLLRNNHPLSFKEQNDYAYSSIKLVFRSQQFSLYFYIIGVMLMVTLLLSIISLSLPLRYIENVGLQRIVGFLFRISNHFMLRALTIYNSLYFCGQFVQYCLFSFSEELNKLRLYQESLMDNGSSEIKSVSEDGQGSYEAWVLIFALSVAIAVIFKVGWLIGVFYAYRVFLVRELSNRDLDQINVNSDKL